MQDFFTVQREAAAAVRHDTGTLGFANTLTEIGFVIEAVFAFAAFRGVERDYVVANRNGSHTGTDFAHNACTFVTEDTCRSHPRLLGQLFRAALDEGVDGLCLCDTVGHATPDGVYNLIHFARNIIRAQDTECRIDWHGHDDRGHSLPNALMAIEAGADRVHGTVLGMGERVGNTPIDLFLVNLKLLGVETADLAKLAELVTLASEACEVPIPPSYPVFGKDAFRTGTGVHAAAVVKALKRGDDWLADRIYSGVPAGWFGLQQIIEVGHYSGMSNVHAWLVSHGMEPEEGVANAIFDFAKSTNRVLEDAEIMEIIQSHRA